MSLLPTTIPPGWQALTVGDLAQYINGMAFKPEDWGREGRPIIRIQNLTDPTKPLNYTTRQVDERFVVHTGEILVSWSATLDAFIWNGPEAVLNQHIFRVVPNSAKVDPRFLFYLLKCVIRDMAESEHLHGSTMKHINRGPFLSFPVSVPEIKEQRRIVARIEEMMERSRRARSALQRVLSDVGTLQSRLYQLAWDQAMYQSTKIVRFEFVLDDIRGGTTQVPTETASEIRVLRSSAVRPGVVDYNDVRFLPYVDEVSEKHLLSNGDLLVTRLSGSLDYVGNVAVVSGLAGQRIAYPDRLFRARLKPEHLGEFYAILFASPAVRAQLESSAKSTAGHQRISISNVKLIKVPLCALDTQINIACRHQRQFDTLSSLAREASEALQKLESFEQSVLAFSFSDRC